MNYLKNIKKNIMAKINSETEYKQSIKQLEMNEPLILSIKHYDKKFSIEVDHSDVTLEELHTLWTDLLTGMGFHPLTIEEFYE